MKIKEVERSRLISQVDPNCPPGHTVLSETERIDSLNIAQKSELIEKIKRNTEIKQISFQFQSIKI